MLSRFTDFQGIFKFTQNQIPLLSERAIPL